MKKLCAVLLAVLCASPAYAFLETGVSKAWPGPVATFATTFPVASGNVQAGVQNGDLLLLFIHRGEPVAGNAPITITGSNIGTWTLQTCASGSNNMPLSFNTIASPTNGFWLYTSTYSSSGVGSGAPTFNWTNSKNSAWFMLSMANTSGALVNCWAARSDSAALGGTGAVNTSIPANNELVFAYDFASSNNSLSAATSPNTFTTLDKNSTAQTTTQDPTAPLGTFASGLVPTMFLLDANLGPNGASSPGKAFQATATTAAANIGIAIQLAPAAFDPRPYPAGSMALNNAGAKLFSQIDQAAIPATWKQPFIDTIATYRSWFSIETGCDTFNWDKTDNDVLNARTWGKRLQLGINSMGTTPPTSTSWIYAGTCDGETLVPTYESQLWTQNFGPTTCTALQVPFAGDANYQALASSFMSKYAARYGGLTGTNGPVERIVPLGMDGLGTIELSTFAKCEGQQIGTGGTCGAGTNQTTYWSGASHSYTANGWTTANAGSNMATAQATFEQNAITDWGLQIVNQTTDTPNIANSNFGTSSCVSFSGHNNFNGTFMAHDLATWTHQRVAEQSNALGCSSNCFYANDYLGPTGANVLHNPQVTISYQYVSAQSAVGAGACSGAGIYTPSANDCNVPALNQCLLAGCNGVEIYPADATTALDYPWFQGFSDYQNNRNGAFF